VGEGNGLRLLAPTNVVLDAMDETVGKAYRAALDKLRAAGAVIVEAEVPAFNALAAINDLVAVTPEILEAHGAVSAQVAKAMADGARERLGVDVAVSVTGVAGPDGGSAAKPVGLTYVAVADRTGDDVRRFVWDSDRRGNKRFSAAAALELVLERLTEPPA